jgi:predicted RecA/RadA family phage recombinase
MRNFVQRGTTLTLPAPATVVSGAGVQVGSIFGVAAEDCAQGGPVDLTVEGVFTLPKVAAQALAIGDAVYWDAVGKLVTSVGTGNQRIGVVVVMAPNPSGSVDVRLNGSF